MYVCGINPTKENLTKTRKLCSCSQLKRGIVPGKREVPVLVLASLGGGVGGGWGYMHY